MKKVLRILSSLLVGAVMLVPLPAHAVTQCPPGGLFPNCFQTGYTAAAPQGSIVDQAVANFTVPTLTGSTDSGSAFWVGVQNANYGSENGVTGSLLQAGIVTQNLGFPLYVAFYELVGTCSTNGTVAIGAQYPVQPGNSMYFQVSILDNTHYDIIMDNLTTGWKYHKGSTYCSVAYHFEGNDVTIGERPTWPSSSFSNPCGTSRCYSRQMQFQDRAFLSPRLHIDGEGGNVYHYLSAENWQGVQAEDCTYHNGVQWVLSHPGGFGSNSNFTVYWDDLGTVCNFP